MYEKVLDNAANFNMSLHDQRTVITFETSDEVKARLKRRRTEGSPDFLGEFLTCSY